MNVERLLPQVSVGMLLASTNPVPPRLRGKLNGLFLMSQSLGRTIGPVAWALMYAWSISPSGGGNIPLVDHRFIFIVSAMLSVVVVLIGWHSLTEESMTHVVEDPLSGPSMPLDGFGELVSQVEAPYTSAWDAVSVVSSRDNSALDINSLNSDRSAAELEAVVVKDRRADLV